MLNNLAYVPAGYYLITAEKLVLHRYYCHLTAHPTAMLIIIKIDIIL